MKTDCPECGEPLVKPFEACKCGWRKNPERKKKGTIPKICAFREMGFQCTLYGALSTNVNGEGPWYCRDHFADIMKWPRPAPFPKEETMADVDARVNKIVPRKLGESEHDWSMRCRDYVLKKVRALTAEKRTLGKRNLTWANNIMARRDNGEVLSSISLTMAADVLAMHERETRAEPAFAEQSEPGEDG